MEMPDLSKWVRTGENGLPEPIGSAKLVYDRILEVWNANGGPGPIGPHEISRLRRFHLEQAGVPMPATPVIECGVDALKLDTYIVDIVRDHFGRSSKEDDDFCMFSVKLHAIPDTDFNAQDAFVFALFGCAGDNIPAPKLDEEIQIAVKKALAARVWLTGKIDRDQLRAKFEEIDPRLKTKRLATEARRKAFHERLARIDYDYYVKGRPIRWLLWKVGLYSPPKPKPEEEPSDEPSTEVPDEPA